MLKRTLEPEAMDSDSEASDYDAMDHSVVNEQFVEDLLAFSPELTDVLDLGTGTAQIPIVLCRHHATCRVMAVDLSVPMLEIARYNLEAAGVVQRVQLDQVDAKDLPYLDEMFEAVISNSIIHHIPDPQPVFSELARVLQPGGRVFLRDLLRPESEAHWQQLVDTYAADCNEYQRKLFGDSLKAAFTLDEVRQMVEKLGWDAETVNATSDRHWTWADVKQ